MDYLIKKEDIESIDKLAEKIEGKPGEAVRAYIDALMEYDPDAPRYSELSAIDRKTPKQQVMDTYGDVVDQLAKEWETKTVSSKDITTQDRIDIESRGYTKHTLSQVYSNIQKGLKKLRELYEEAGIGEGDFVDRLIADVKKSSGHVVGEDAAVALPQVAMGNSFPPNSLEALRLDKMLSQETPRKPGVS